MVQNALLDTVMSHVMQQTKEDAGRASQRVPEDVEQLKLKNLDTGEEYIIGENDPDFEFDTFELRGEIQRH